ncbi:MAG: hypothetical protein WC781_03260 [Candidatus Pacearchaeota archaeon]|jgi:hypothetical protein
MVKKRKIRKEGKPVNKGKIPAGVQVLSIILYIISGICLILGLLIVIVTIFEGNIINSQISSSNITSQLQENGYTPEEIVAFQNLIVPLIGLIGIIFILGAILDFFIARGLWKGQKWSRILFTIMIVFFFFNSLSSLIHGKFFNIISIIVYCFIIWYLFFVEEVKKFFS